MHITVTTRIDLLSMPSTNTRTTAFKRANPARFLGEGDGPIKNLLPISITQREHPLHLGEFGLTQGTPIPALRALLQGQTQQILSCQGVRQEHRQLRPILRHITTPSQHPHTQQHHTSARPQNKTATNPTVHHAPIQPHAHPPSVVVRLEDRNHNFTREQTPPTRPPALPIQPAKALTRPHVTTATNTHHGFEPIQISPTPLTVPQEP